MMLTMPVVFPIVVYLGFDPVWFGIMITVLMEAALITPPIGINLMSSTAFVHVAVSLMMSASVPYHFCLVCSS